MKKFICLMMALLMMCACLASCGGSGDGDSTTSGDTTPAETTTAADETTTPEETTTEAPEYDLTRATAELEKLYADAKSGETLDLVDKVTVDGLDYTVEWAEPETGYELVESDHSVNSATVYNATITADGESAEYSFTVAEDKVDVSRFKGKKVATFGTSITWYHGNAYTWGKEHNKIAVGYQQYMEDYLGLDVDNYGLSGNTIPQIMRSLASKNITSYDYITIKGGANDERHGTPLGTVKPIGSSYDLDTFIGSIQAGIEYIQYYNPDCTILLMTPPQGWIYAPEGYGAANPQTKDGIVTDKWSKAIKEIAELYDLEVCDIYEECGFTLANRNEYMNDPEPPTNKLYSLHPSTAGYKVMGDIVVKAFLEKY